MIRLPYSNEPRMYQELTGEIQVLKVGKRRTDLTPRINYNYGSKAVRIEWYEIAGCSINSIIYLLNIEENKYRKIVRRDSKTTTYDRPVEKSKLEKFEEYNTKDIQVSKILGKSMREVDEILTQNGYSAYHITTDME